jgi:CubicO group peptidase (beta-lactamase class C family)
MKFKELLKKRKFLIIGVFACLLITIILFLILNKSNFSSPEKGTAAFYEYPASESDSLTALLNDEEKAKSLILICNPKTKKTDFEKTSSNFQGFAFYEFTDSLLLQNISQLKKHKSLIKSVSEDILYNFSNDSTFFVPVTLLNTINDSLILSRYYEYQTEKLLDAGINSLVIKFEIPENIDSLAKVNIANRFSIILNILHRNRILSFVEFSSFPKKQTESDKSNLNKITSEIISNGLCGMIFTNESDFAKIKSDDFDGLKILKLSEKQIPERETTKTFDAFIISNDDENYVSDLRKKIKKFNDKEELFGKCSKIMRAGLWANQEIKDSSAKRSLNIKLLESNITEASVTVLKNSGNLIPVTDIAQKFHIVIATKRKSNIFLNTIANYTTNYTITWFDPASEKFPAVAIGASVLVVLYETGDDESIPEALKTTIKDFKKKTIFINCGKLSKDLPEIDADAIVQIYSSSDVAFSFAGQLIFGGIAAKGTLASSINDTCKFGYGIFTPKTRLKYSMPEDAGLDSEILARIDSIAQYAVNSGAMPGCQIFIARKGIVVYEKSWGYLDYSKTNAVDKTDMYDVASLTKICASTLAMMKMVETGKIKLDDKLEKYFKNTKIDYGKIKPDTVTIVDTVSIAGKSEKEIKELVFNKDTIHIDDTLIRIKQEFITKVTPSANIFQVPVRALLVHQSGISPSLPILPYMFYEDSYTKWKKEEAIKNGEPLPENTKFSRQEAFDYYYSSKWVKDSAELKIAENMYLKKRWQDTLYEDVKRLGTFNRNNYQYTDMNMILAQAIIDTVNKMSIDKFVKKEFYEGLGMRNSTFKPREFNIPYNRIAPTENETFWRRQVIHGYVHDPSAAMLGGLSGNAGLFSTASDLGILGQMWLNGGTYGGRRYLNEGTIKMFSATQPENHRGLGFDKAAARNLNAPSAPASTYGHTGFTGCVMWIDPENEIVYVFLSNRLHPNVKNWQILGQKVLQNVHQVVYDAIIE